MQVQEELVVIKGKRTKRPRPPSPLGTITNMPSPTSNCSAGTSSTNNSGGQIDVATSTTTTSDELGDRTELEDEDIAYCLILLAQGHHHAQKASPSSQLVAAHAHAHDHNDNNKSSLSYLYQCKTCNKCFPSFQALGGHRASHNKPNNKANGAYGIGEKQQGVTSFVNELDDHCDPTTASTILSLQVSSNRPNLYVGSTATSTPSASAKSKVHECSICGAGFSSGQALGGHMRRHRNFMSTSTATTTTTSISGGNIIGGSPESQEAKKPRNVLKLDLNLPAPENDHHRESKFSFQTKENVIVFSESSLVDCHY